MAKKSYVEQHGIIAVAVDQYSVEDARAMQRQRDENPDAWLSHFPSLDWLTDQLERAKADKGGCFFLPHEEWGWYVERMIAYLEILRVMVEKNDSRQAAIYAAEVSALATESNIKFQWEADALRGRKVGEAAKVGGESRASLNIPRDNAIREAYQARLIKMNPASAKRHTAKQFELSDRQVSRIIMKK